ncbi:hypothetical protein Tco_0215144 [Tanacetum coccineum]
MTFGPTLKVEGGNMKSHLKLVLESTEEGASCMLEFSICVSFGWKKCHFLVGHVGQPITVKYHHVDPSKSDADEVIVMQYLWIGGSTYRPPDDRHIERKGDESLYYTLCEFEFGFLYGGSVLVEAHVHQAKKVLEIAMDFYLSTDLDSSGDGQKESMESYLDFRKIY